MAISGTFELSFNLYSWINKKKIKEKKKQLPYSMQKGIKCNMNFQNREKPRMHVVWKKE